MPVSNQPDYINGVVRLEALPGLAEPEPARLLAALQRIELAHGRERSVPNAARTLDLDIIAMGAGGSLVRDAPDPVLPHPRAHLRAFVLLPLQEVAPEWVEPRSRLGTAALIEMLPAAELQPSAIRIA